MTRGYVSGDELRALLDEALAHGDLRQADLAIGALGDRDQAATCMRDLGAVHGWHLIGAGPARYGWATFTAAGAGDWLGATEVNACATLCARAIDRARAAGADACPWGCAEFIATDDLCAHCGEPSKPGDDLGRCRDCAYEGDCDGVASRREDHQRDE